jgi:hypothetical protein
MNQLGTSTLWQKDHNFEYLFNINICNSNKKELFGRYIHFLNQINRTRWNYLDNTDGMLVDDDDFIISDDCEDSYCMEDGNDKYYTFQAINRRIYFMLHIGERISPKCGYIDDYPEQIIPYLLQILKLFFPSLKFTQKLSDIQIWDLNTEQNDFIQHLFLIIRNIQNPEFNFERWKNSGVPDRKDNEFSTKTKKLIRENANYCCESCGQYLNKPNYCKKSGEKFFEYSKNYGYIDHINEHRFGGGNNEENGQLLCHVCHSKKTNMFSKSSKLCKHLKNKFLDVSSKFLIKKIIKK